MSTPSNVIKHEKNEKNEKERRIESGESSIDDAASTELPDSVKINDEGVPTFAGLSGNKLLWMITATASAGFGLFGCKFYFVATKRKTPSTNFRATLFWEMVMFR
jgi:hypothetical protein